MKVIKHIRIWDRWRKHCLNGKFYKILVLFGILRSPTFRVCALEEEWKNMYQKNQEVK